MTIDELIYAFEEQDFDSLDNTMTAQAVRTLRSMEARLKLADELVEHILTSESRNPELGLAEAYVKAGGEK